MSTRSMLHQANLNEWSKRLADQKSSGLSVMEWCKLNYLSKYQYFYWKRQLKYDNDIIGRLKDLDRLGLLNRVLLDMRIELSAVVRGVYRLGFRIEEL